MQIIYFLNAEYIEISSLEYDVNEVNCSKEIFTTLNLLIDDCAVKVRVDTGAKCSMITTDMVKKIGNKHTVDTSGE